MVLSGNTVLSKKLGKMRHSNEIEPLLYISNQHSGHWSLLSNLEYWIPDVKPSVSNCFIMLYNLLPLEKLTHVLQGVINTLSLPAKNSEIMLKGVATLESK